MQSKNFFKFAKIVLAVLSSLMFFSCASRTPEHQTFNFDEIIESCDGDIWEAMHKFLYTTKSRIIDTYTLEFTEGKVYSVPKSPLDPAFIDMRDLHDVIIDGCGATIELDAYNGFISLAKCKNITVKNFNVVYKRISFTQGEVVALDAGAGFFILKIQKGYPYPPSDDWAKKTFGTHAWQWGNFFDKNSLDIKRTELKAAVISKIETTQVQDEFKISIANLALLKDVVQGDKFVMSLPIERNNRQENLTARRYENINAAPNEDEKLSPPPMCADISVLDSANVIVQAIHLKRSRMSGVIAMANTGKVLFEDCSISAMGTDLISSWRYGMLFVGNKVGAVINNCSFSRNLDDAIVIATHPVMISKVLGPRKYEITNGNIDAENSIAIFYPNTGKIVDDVRILSKENNVILTDRPIPNPIAGDMRRVVDKNATQIYNMDEINTGFSVSNSKFSNSLANAISISAHNGAIVANKIEGSRGNAITLGNESGAFFSGPFPKNILIVGNEISNSEKSPIHIGLATSENNPVDYEYGIHIAENKISLKDGKTHIAEIGNGKKVHFSDNECYDAKGEEISSNGAIKLGKNAKDVSSDTE